MLYNLTDPESGQLSILYQKWKESPEFYGKEMSDTVDKIIYSTLNGQSLQPIYKKFEEKADLIQELRYLCFKKLGNISNPTNKRIFNFLKISIVLALKDKTRRVGKRLDREPIERAILGEKSPRSSTSFFYFNDQLLEDVATLLSDGETKQDICKLLNITRSQLNKQVKKLKVIYSEKA